MPDTTTYPIIDSALSWLSTTQVLTPNQRAAIDADAAITGSASAATVEQGIIDRLRQALLEGDDRERWRNRLSEVFETADHEAEAIGRTFVKRQYNAGRREVVEQPLIADLFLYRAYYKTLDNRIRPTHRLLGGSEKNPVVAHKDSPLAKLMEQYIDEWGCRCSVVNISREEALGLGIDDDTGWIDPAGTRAEPQVATLPEPQPPPLPTLTSGEQIDFQPHPTARQNKRRYTTIEVDPRKLEELWKERDAEGYLPTQSGAGASEISGRREGFEQFLSKPDRPAIETPKLTFDDRTGGFAFVDGRHRSRVLLDKGIDRLPVTVDRREATALRERIGVDEPPAFPIGVYGEVVNYDPLLHQLVKGQRIKGSGERAGQQVQQQVEILVPGGRGAGREVRYRAIVRLVN